MPVKVVGADLRGIDCYGNYHGEFSGSLVDEVIDRSPGSVYVGYDVETLEEARTSASYVGKTIVVTTELTESQSNILGVWPADRALKIEKGGSIANTTTCAFAGSVFAGDFRVFRGIGLVTGLKEALPEWFGASGDGLNDDSAATQMAVNAARVVKLGAKTYLWNTRVDLRSSNSLIGSGVDSTIIKKGATTVAATGILAADSDSATLQLSNIVLRDFTIMDDVVSLGFTEHQHLVSLAGVSDVTINRVKFTGFRGDGLYIGQWYDPTFTRINTGISVHECIFDGINKNNRNAISVITGSNIRITSSDFRNCTSATMPGAIDFEPNGVSGTETISNCVVTGCTFTNIGGNVGAVGFVLNGMTIAPTSVVVSNNTFTGVGTFFAINSPNLEFPEPINIALIGNSGSCRRPFSITGKLAGISVSSNTFYATNTALLGYDAGDTIKNAVITGNSFTCVATSLNGGMAVRGVSGGCIGNNTFSSYNDYAISVGITGSTISNVSIMNNVGLGLRGAGYLVMHGGGTFDNSCGYSGNMGGTHNFRAWRTDYCGAVSNGSIAGSELTFNGLTLPDSFPIGTSRAAINGTTYDGIPAATGGYQGVLITHKLSGLAANYTYQTYYHASNTLKLGSFWIRRRAQSTNTWTAWVEQAS